MRVDMYTLHVHYVCYDLSYFIFELHATKMIWTEMWRSYAYSNAFQSRCGRLCRTVWHLEWPQDVTFPWFVVDLQPSMKRGLGLHLPGSAECCPHIHFYEQCEKNIRCAECQLFTKNRPQHSLPMFVVAHAWRSIKRWRSPTPWERTGNHFKPIHTGVRDGRVPCGYGVVTEQC